MESLGEEKKYTDKRIKIIEKTGMISSKDLSKITGVSGPAISQWMKPLVEKGILIWCGESGNEFSDIKSLEKAKRSGKAFIKVAGFSCLPTPYQLTGDKRWDNDGDFYNQYDLEFDEDNIESAVFNERDQLPQDTKTSPNLLDLTEIHDTDKTNEGVKVLSEKCDLQNKKLDVNDEINSNENADDLFKEFQEVLSVDKNLSESQKGNNQNCSTPPFGVLTI